MSKRQSTLLNKDLWILLPLLLATALVVYSLRTGDLQVDASPLDQGGFTVTESGGAHESLDAAQPKDSAETSERRTVAVLKEDSVDLQHDGSLLFSARAGVMHLPPYFDPIEKYLRCPTSNADGAQGTPEQLVRLQSMIDSYNEDLRREQGRILKLQQSYIHDQVAIFDRGVPFGSEEANALGEKARLLRDGFLATHSNPSLGVKNRVVYIAPGECPGLDDAYNMAWAVLEHARSVLAVQIAAL